MRTWIVPEIRSLEDASVKQQWEITAITNCRGVYTFAHDGRVMIVYAASHSAEDGAQFKLLDWAEAVPVTESTPATNLPNKPFAMSGSVYEGTTQMAVAVPAQTNSRAAEDVAVTDLYLCAPGAGIGAYRITTNTEVMNSVAEVLDSAKEIVLRDGNLIFGTGSYDGKMVEVFSFDGRMVDTVVIKNGVADCGMLSAGLYVAKTPAGIVRIAL